MKFRFFQVCDKFGQWSTPVLQYWDEDSVRWIDINTICCSDLDQEEYMTDEDAC